MANIDLYTIGKGPHRGIFKDQKKSMSRETEKPSLMMIDGKPIDGTSTSGRDQDGHGMMKSEDLFSTEIFLRVSCTCSSDYSVYDGWCTDTHLLHAHLSAHNACTITFAHLHACTFTHGSSVMSKRCLLHMCHTSPSRLLYLLSHPSLLFLHAYFNITFPSTFLPNFPVLKAQDMRNSARAPRSLASWPSPVSTQLTSATSGHCTIWSSTRHQLSAAPFSAAPHHSSQTSASLLVVSRLEPSSARSPPPCAHTRRCWRNCRRGLL